MNSKVTILLATFNRAHLILETLQSIQNQTYQNWECIIVDDYSADNTKEVIEKFIEKDTRFSYYLKTENYKKGLSGTRNQGLDIAAGRNAEYIQLFDDDDIMHPQKLELQIEPFKNDNNLDLTLCLYRKFWSDATINLNLETANDIFCKIESINLFEDFLFNKININSPGPLWKYSSIKNYRFDETLSYSEERDFYLRVFLNEKIYSKSINYVLFWYRKHNLAITSNLYEDQSIKTSSANLVYKKIFYMILEQNKIKSNALTRYLILSAYRLNDPDLFHMITLKLEFSYLEKVKWIIFYKTLPLRIFLFNIKKKYK